MSICQQCGVECEENANFCSLCGAALFQQNNLEADELALQIRDRKVLNNYRKLTPMQRWKIFWEIAGMILFAGMFISLTINLVTNQAVTWAKYVVTVGLLIFINITLLSFLQRRVLLLHLLSFLSTTVFITVLDMLLELPGSITSLGIPLLLAAYFIVYVLIQLEKRTKQKGLNLIAYILLALGILCMCTDGIISIYTAGVLTVSWSLTVMVSAILIAALLLYVHHRLKKVTDLKRFFHI